MKIAYENENVTLWHGDCLEKMKEIEDGSIDAVITDPPYGLVFMGKEWDKGVPSVAFWVEMMRVFQPLITVELFWSNASILLL